MEINNFKWFSLKIFLTVSTGASDVLATVYDNSRVYLSETSANGDSPNQSNPFLIETLADRITFPLFYLTGLKCVKKST